MSKSLSARGRMLLTVAEHAIAAGMKVLAAEPRAKNPDVRFSPHGLNSATDSLKEVKRWLKADDQINLAGALKDTGICAVDVDGPEGEKALRRITKVSKTRKTKTRNGSHRFYRYDADLGGSVIKLAPDLDFIMSGYVMLPGARHPEGGLYKSDDFSFPIADMSPELAKAIRNHRQLGKKSREQPEAEANIVKGRRNDSLASIAGSLRRQGYEEEVILTMLDAFNRHYCRPPLRSKEVERIAHSISRYAPEHEGLFGLMSNVTPRDVAFLWKPYFVRGAINLLEGDPNVGKTFLLCKLAAAISSGTPLPGHTEATAQNVLFMSAEDDPETTLVRRLMRMGAELDRIWFMNKFLRLDEDIIQLVEKHIAQNKVAVILIDPLLAYMQGGIDMNKANETRPFMARLAELAKAHDVTIIALRHLNKADKDKAIFRGLGSVDITAAARSAVMVGLHPEDDETRVFVHIKHNLSARGDSLLYTLEGATDSEVPELIWGGATDLTAEDLARKANKVGRPDEASQEAEIFLKRALAGGVARRIKDIMRDAEKRSISDRTLRKAARKMGIIKKGQTWKLAETSS